jgi:methionyl-tRNA synthetase
VPEPGTESKGQTEWNARTTVQACRAAFDRFDFSSALTAAWTYVSDIDKLIAEVKPWELAKSASLADQEKLRGTLFAAVQALRTLAVVLYPVMPATAERLWKQLGQSGDIPCEPVEDQDGNPVTHFIAPGTKVGKPAPIFPRLDKAVTLAKLDELAEADRNRDKPKEVLKSVENEKSPEAAPTPEPPSGTDFQPVKEDPARMAVPQAASPQSLAPSPAAVAEIPKISIEDFAKVEMRTGEIKTAEPIPGAKKLLKLTVDIGTEVRQVCAGIAEFYSPEKLIGMKVVVVTNLQPRKLRGVESNGMIVAASIGDQGRPVLVTFSEEVPNGARLR